MTAFMSNNMHSMHEAQSKMSGMVKLLRLQDAFLDLSASYLAA